MQLVTRLCFSSLALHSPSRCAHLRTAGARASLSTDEGKVFHALGYDAGESLGQLRGFTAENVDDILSGVRAALLEEPPQVPMAEYFPRAMEILEARLAKKAQEAVAEGTAALKKAAAEEGAFKTESGLVVLMEREGEGDPPQASDTVLVHYEGTLLDDSVFDSSYARNEPISFVLTDVIEGWTEGIQLMKVGGQAKLTIPPELAYGERGSPVIPPMATIVFKVELLAIKPKE